jgi:predicted nucleic acid-binding protein
MIYLDTNILVSLHLTDSLTLPATEWIASQIPPLAMSEWVRAEFHAVMGLRKRKAELSAAEAKAAVAALDVRAEGYLHMLTITNDAAALAAVWLRNPDCNLQTGDALHLAIAHTAGATTLATCDERFAKAAQKLKLANLKIVLIGEKVRRVEQTRPVYKVARLQPRLKVSSRKK